MNMNEVNERRRTRRFDLERGASDLLYDLGLHLASEIKRRKLSTGDIASRMAVQPTTIYKIKKRLLGRDTGIRLALLLRYIYAVKDIKSDYQLVLNPNGEHILTIEEMVNLRKNEILPPKLALRSGYVEWRDHLASTEAVWSINPTTSMFIYYYVYAHELNVKALKFSKQDIDKIIEMNYRRRENLCWNVYKFDQERCDHLRSTGKFVMNMAGAIVQDVAIRMIDGIDALREEHGLYQRDLDKVLKLSKGCYSITAKEVRAGKLEHIRLSSLLLYKYAITKLIGEDVSKITIPINSKTPIESSPREARGFHIIHPEPVNIDQLLDYRRQQYNDEDMYRLLLQSKHRLHVLEDGWKERNLKSKYIYYVFYGIVLGCKDLAVTEEEILRYIERRDREYKYPNSKKER